jgi:hypothetical protein
MNRILPALIFLMLASSIALAQSNGESRGNGYVYFAPGVTTPGGRGTMHIGAGGEGFFNRYVGAGLDAGYVAPYESFSDGIGTLSPNFVARFRPKTQDNKVEPFVTGGYTLFFRSGTANGANVGGGVNWWFKEHVGMRFEVRDNIMIESSETAHFVGFRFGLTFRKIGRCQRIVAPGTRAEEVDSR